MPTSLSSSFDERQWVEQIRQTLDDEHEEENEAAVSIFGVPKALKIIHPESYFPQHVAIGPYHHHHLRAELHDMERYKVAAAKRFQKDLQNIKMQNIKIHDIVDHLIKFELKIRASYHRPVSFCSEALAWMVAVDACFLFEFFQVCGVKRGVVLNKYPSRLVKLIDIWRNETAYSAILRDAAMLENQIPMFVMRMLLEFQFSSQDLADEVLLDMLVGLSQELSPLKTLECSDRIGVKDCTRLLDFLYHLIVPKSDVVASEVVVICEEEVEEKEDGENNNSFSTTPSYFREFLDALWRILSNLEAIQRMVRFKSVQVVVNLPWATISKIPVFKMFKSWIESMFRFSPKDDGKKKEEDAESSSNGSIHEPPLLEEIAIPSVTELSEVGVSFLPTNGGITSMVFDQKTLTLYLPTIVLDLNTEVVLRNLVAYEACAASGPLVLARYTELMNGIIDTEKDVKILCQKGIILNHLKSEREVAELWNGMSRSTKLTKVSSLDKLIADVNRYYNGRWKVKLGNVLKRSVFGSWKILTFLATVMLLMLMSLQAVCQVYSCGRISRVNDFDPSNM